jgi:hypothetical protein
MVNRNGYVYIIEIKAPGKRKSLTINQQKTRALWGKAIHTIETSEEIFKIVGLK